MFRTHTHRRKHTHIPHTLPHTHTPPKHPLWTPLHGYSTADKGADQQDEISGLTPPHFQGQSTHSRRTNIPSHPDNSRKGSARQHTHYRKHSHRIRHTPNTHHTHTRHTVSEDFTFTHPGQGTYKYTWGWFDKSNEPSSTGVLHTNLSWFRQILSIQGNGKKGAQIEQGRHRKWARVKEDRHKGWANTGMIPSEIKKVDSYEDFLPFYDWLLQHLGGRQRYILYHINLDSSPHPRCDLDRNNWIEKICPEKIIQWERAIYRILKLLPAR